MSAAEREREDRELLELEKQTSKSSQSHEAQIQKVWVVSLLFRYRSTVPERKKNQWCYPSSVTEVTCHLTIYIMIDVYLIFYYTTLTKRILMA